jgi:hypothetical protein
LTHDLLGGFVDSSSSSGALVIFPEVTIFGGLEKNQLLKEWQMFLGLRKMAW